MTTTDARQRIRFASEGEELRYWRRHPGASFTCLVCIVTRDGGRLRYRFLRFSVPRAILPDLPTDPDIIHNMSEGRGVIVRRPGGWMLKGYAAEWSRKAV